ncbi:hypothetical protein [Shewanella sp. UCD-KL12]|uniref:hypothetical protein n=1 Tax=Shewanella sp. UCD-KL12 TaxID=1917163 RepID=UPI000970FF85|nr:hypothetical protein [Shewanella sp. UCD-KL12]
MLDNIKVVLKEKPGLKGREIARELNKDRKEVNSFLAKNSDGLYQIDYKWFIEDTDTVEWNIDKCSWLACDSFEESYLGIGNILLAKESNVIINFPEDCKILLIAGARIMALANQLHLKGKNVTLNFGGCPKARGYLNRLGFFDYVNSDIEVLPGRPKASKAKKYKGNSKNLVEIGNIDLQEFNEELPKELTTAFTHHAGEEYYMAAFTVFSELIGNVEEHSETPIPGFAALQLYNGREKHIQIVISDHGLGLTNTLKTGLAEHYPDLASSLDLDDIESDIVLIKKALVEGKLSRYGHNPENIARGLGLKKSQDYALKYNAEITVRQESILVKLLYKEGKLVNSFYQIDLGFLAGTHICFDFILD